ncbi:hypothetical protein LEMA_uP011180.1 [Plenodomus lingam JN3]|uniref:FAD-binding domain-containing protein n=1 Tax=Leptosphaeria maculans (strain JN3 / isolate v23.1.3 / race Av1-4-5-6-7-8) TaxID=985895 RepID=E5ACX9_LEPMJ|nr:hypothetical protein LEMA_uP011180.1 [Plenodomus lingam JN3]CBY02331.1 hypothetical protein LEMA_uP011180.1 [Plenodomus lingam JN3]
MHAGAGGMRDRGSTFASMPKTDVLIAGSGSAGIFAAAWLAIYNIPFTILERRNGPLEIGQADGVQVRTVEIYERVVQGGSRGRAGVWIRRLG